MDKKAGNNYAFIDSQNLNLGINKLNWKLDFKKFRIYLKEKYKVSQVFLFIGFIPENQDLYSSSVLAVAMIGLILSVSII